ncbi:MAG TPA: hypothetical protein VKA97_01470, partial [Pyrinomonadaceae bacterium]|nr:hypothetical protein [Pyrinomonadaceae bacterium]
ARETLRGLCLKPAPKARNIKARGKREARRPWFYAVRAIRPEGPKYNFSITPLSGLGEFDSCSRGDALRACPWLSHSAPSALHSEPL